MTKQSGLGDNLILAGYDISNDTGGLSRIGGGLAATQDVTGIDRVAYERVGLGRDGSIEYSGFLNPTADRAHTVQKALPRTDVAVTYCRGTTLGDPAAFMLAKQINYDFTRGTDGALTTAVSAQANGYGLTWGVQLTPGLRSEVADTEGASVDLGGVAPGFGAVGLLQVTALTGADATIVIEESSDNGGADAWAAVLSFAEVTAAHTTERKAVTGNVERYVRVTTTGAFTALTFNVAFVRHVTAVTY